MQLETNQKNRGSNIRLTLLQVEIQFFLVLGLLMWARSTPDRNKISNFGENEFIRQNLNFYRKQYEQDFKFWDPDPTDQVVFNIIDDGDPLYQQ